jgi:hypothetical protein
MFAYLSLTQESTELTIIGTDRILVSGLTQDIDMNAMWDRFAQLDAMSDTHNLNAGASSMLPPSLRASVRNNASAVGDGSGTEARATPASSHAKAASTAAGMVSQLAKQIQTMGNVKGECRKRHEYNKCLHMLETARHTMQFHAHNADLGIHHAFKSDLMNSAWCLKTAKADLQLGF